jgi:hypothetical protein
MLSSVNITGTGMNDSSSRPPIANCVVNMQRLAPGAKVMEGKRFSSSVSAEKLGEWAKEFIV